MVARCAVGSASPESVLATLDRDARVLRQFVADGRSLAGSIAGLPSDTVEASPHMDLIASLEHHAQVMAAVPDDLRPAADEEGLAGSYREWVMPGWGAWAWPLNRFLAAKAFANWTAYQGRGVLSIVRGLNAALALVRVEAARQCRDAGRPLDRELLLEAFRSADFALNHLAVGEDLAAAWSQVER